MPCIHQVPHPLAELFLLERVNDIRNVGSRQVFSFSQGDWKCSHHIWMPGRPVKHRFNLEPIEMRHRYVFHQLRLNSCSGAGHQLLQVVYRHRVVGAQVAAAVVREESPDFPLTLELCTKARRIYGFCQVEIVLIFTLWSVLHLNLLSIWY